MTIQIRSLVVSGVCLVGIACSDAAPAPAAANKVAPKGVPAMQSRKPSFAQEDMPALTATAEASPRTVMDGPEKKKEELDGAKDAGSKAELSALSGHEEPIDYSRPLAAAEVTLKRFVLATGVEDREPLEETDTFTGEQKIFAFMELSNPDAEPYAFRVHFEPLEGPLSPYGVVLNVNTSPRFRTWSWTAIPREPGQYRAVLRTLEGEEIASRSFTIIGQAVSE
jgi:hypothetical protein